MKVIFFTKMQMLRNKTKDGLFDHIRADKHDVVKKTIDLIGTEVLKTELGDSRAAVAAYFGAHKSLKVIIDEDPDQIELRSSFNRRPLHFAALRGHLSCAEMLLSHPTNPADVNAVDQNGHTPLILAIKSGHESMAEYLLNNRAYVNGIPRGDFENTGAEASSIATLFERNCKPEFPLIIAAIKGYADIISNLFEYGVDHEVCDENQRNAIHHVVLNGHYECLEVLLFEIPRDKLGEAINALDKDQSTPLILAASVGRVDILKQLMETYLVDYFSLNCCGQSALTLAIENGHVDCVEYLLTLEHISIYQQDFDEFTAYDVATKNLQLALKDEFGTDDKIG